MPDGESPAPELPRSAAADGPAPRIHDVAIVGAGPVGVFFAAALAQRGIDVVVFDKRSRAHRHSRAIGIHPPSLAALGRLGVLDEIVVAGVRIDRGVLRIHGRERARLDFASTGAQLPFVVSLPQLETERILRTRLAELAPDALRTGVEVLRVGREAASVRLDLGGGLPSVRARMAVGADGLSGVVAAALGQRGAGRSYPYRYLMGDFADATGDGALAVLHLHPSGIVESFPLPAGRRRWVTHLPAGVGDESADAALLARLIAERIAPEAAPDPATATMSSAFGVRRRILSRMASDDGRLAVIGDAAHEVSPIGGQGMNLGWLDADALAERMPALLAALGSPPHDAASPLADLGRARLRSARAAARISEFNMTMGRPTSAAGFALRRAVVATASLPPLGRTLARAFTMHDR
ncbi:MAG: FAD-dependent monooxygenase [Herbiconiux sp.]|uniref:FAD-dependent oxidoreductase n=1 Tax=Herbiconiux sp. TaxID=1871186 RepID=UPI0011FA085D|nr:NAD(P)/FAD-dependent oxidoreductase [Herbiconiux sp.]TAJ49690.1 MAG: FAD-dependent monooxygenase [Herbiconiux sp.]